MKKLTQIAFAILFSTGLLLAACSGDANNKSLNNSADTGNTREGQHHDIPADTAKIDSANHNSQGNADPSGRGEADVHPAH